MIKETTYKLSRESTRRKYIRRLSVGATEMLSSRKNAVIMAIHVVIVLLLYFCKEPLINYYAHPLIRPMLQSLYGFIIPVYGILIAGVIVYVWGTPHHSDIIERDLLRAGLVNAQEEAPILLTRRTDKNNPKLSILEFYSLGIPVSMWLDKQVEIETALNMYIAKIAEGPNRQSIMVHAVPADHAFPSMLPWKEEYLPDEDFTLALGEGLAGPVTVNIALLPHILAAGTTGSGKSNLVRCLIGQCLHKGADCIICDFKGGADFGKAYAQRCTMCYSEDELLPILRDIMAQMEERKRLLRESDCANISEYNQKTGNNIKRIVFVCDEVIELFDKAGASKEQKAKLLEIEGMISSIARIGRALNVNLLLAGQRIDAQVINGSIRNNLTTKLCGRADDNLSLVTLGCTAASDLIPKDSRGRFIMEDGTVFQGYYFTDDQV